MGVYTVVSRKSSNTENTPLRPPRIDASSVHKPRTITSALIRAHANRRRVRANGAQNTSAFAVEHMRRRDAAKKEPQIRIQLNNKIIGLTGFNRVPGNGIPIGAPVSTRFTVGLPRYLYRPKYKPIPKEKIAAIDPALADLPEEYLQDRLAEFGVDMVRVCSSIEGSVAPESTFPRELSVLVNDHSAAMPTHMFGVYSRENPQPGEKRRLTIYPQHAIVWAAHCASLPTLPSSSPSPPASPTDRLTLPVVPLRLPDPESFPLLSTYLYTHRLELLLQNLLPAPPPAAHADAEVLMGYARMLARTFTGHALYEHLMKLQGLWKNSTALGIFEPGLWAMIDLVWEILINALSMCHENPLADTIPPPMPAKTFPRSYAMETDPAPMSAPALVPVPSSPLRAQL